MAEVFKCGSIASIINKSQNEDNSDHNSPKKKKTKKLMNKFNDIIEENNCKSIEIKKIVAKDEEEVESDNDNESDEEMPLKEEIKVRLNRKEKKLRDKQQKMDQRDDRTVFVGNLPQNITIKYLKRLFKSCGKIENIRLRGAVPEDQKISKKVAVITKSFNSSKDNINAYVVYKSPDSVVNALELNGNEIDGHHIRVDKAAADDNRDNSRSIFVGNLPFIVKEEDLHETFKECGDVEGVRVIRDSATGIGKGFGFILFKSKDSVVLALEKNDFKLNGRELRVVRAKNETPKPKKERLKRRVNEDNTDQTDKEEPKERRFKKNKTSNTKSEFEGIVAKKAKRKVKKGKEIKSLKVKKQQKKLSQIFSK